MTTKITLNNIADTALATLTGPKVTTIVYPGTETATDVVGGATINLTGGGFQSGCSVLVASTASSVVTFISSTQISFIAPALAAGTYVIYVINPDGGTAISIPGISYSGTPNWTTTAGTLGNAYETGAISTTLTATGDAPITYTLASGTLPTGSTLASNGTISGTAQATASATTYSFTVTAKDAQNQTTNRGFSLTINPDVVTWSTPTASATYNVEKDSVMANVTMSATSAAGGSITYTADTLPTGLSITGANIAGTPTVTANTTTVLTATATSTRAATRTINWVVSVASDTYFKNTTLLLSGNGTNNAQNNTFVDGSTNNFTITRAGNTTQGTFSPYGPNWSNFFGASTSNRISSPANAAFAFGTGAFTVEAWIYITDLTAENFIFDTRSSVSTSGVGFSIEPNTGKLRYSGNANNVLTSTGITANTWYHVAWVYNGTTLTGYINGVSSGTATPSFNITQNNGEIGNVPFSGVATAAYLSNVRVVKGTAVYTSNFTPSTTSLTAISGTSLLTCQSNRFQDNSSNAFTLTVSGTPSVQRFSPFSPTATYSASTIGGSGYFDGTGDYLSVTEAAGTASAATVECWIYPITQVYSGDAFIVGNSGNALGAWALSFKSTNNTIGVWLDSYSGITITSNNTINYNTWNHIAVVKTGGVIYLYVNGIRQTSTYTQAGTFGRGTVVQVGQYTGGGQEFTGYISDVRTVYGVAVYSGANFTPPTAPLTAITNTQLLLNFTNAGIIDNTMINNLQTVGDAKISTTQSKFGGSSIYLDGTGDWLTIPSNPIIGWGTDAFTIECWLYWTGGSGENNLFCVDVTGGLNLYLNISSNWGIATRAVTINNAFGTAPTKNVWHHIAVSRSGSTVYAFIDGTLVYSGANTTNYIPGPLAIASIPTAAGNTVSGYVDDVRITKGYARYTANFTPPTSAFNGR